MDKSFSIVDILETSWEITKKNFLVIIGYSIVAFVVFALVQLSSVFVMSLNNPLVGFIALFLLLITNSIATLGFYKLIFQLIDSEEEETSFSSVIPSWKNIFSFITLSMVIGFFVALGTLIFKKLLTIKSFAQFVEVIESNPINKDILAVFAFIILMMITVRFMFFPSFIVDDDSSALESLRQSRALTHNNLLKIFGILGIVVGFIALGFLALGVGIIVTYPFTNVILVVTYRRLVNDYITEHPEESGS